MTLVLRISSRKFKKLMPFFLIQKKKESMTLMGITGQGVLHLAQVAFKASISILMICLEEALKVFLAKFLGALGLMAVERKEETY